MSKMKYGDFYSGMSCPALALRQMGIDFDYLFACDIDKKAITFLKNNFEIDQIYQNVKEIDLDTLPSVDLFVAGFPCQPFSSANNITSGKDHKSFGLHTYPLEYIKKKQPKWFILENVRGLTFKKNKDYLKEILDTLDNLNGYTYDYKVLNSIDYGTPQSRSRIWFIGNRIDQAVKFPTPIPLNYTINDVLDLDLGLMKPFKTRCKNECFNTMKNGFNIDNGQTTGKFTKIYHLPEHKFSYCVIVSNPPSLFYKSDDQILFRYFNVDEYLKLFKITIPLNMDGISSGKMKNLLGNGMELGILEKLLELIVNIVNR